MIKKEFEKFWVTQAGIVIKDGKCLVLELAGAPGKWDIPGGRIDVGEAGNSEAAFRREMKEEIGLEKFDIVDLATYDIWYNNEKDQGMCALVFLLDNFDLPDEIQLSHEHINYKWITEDEIKDEFFWPGAEKMLKAGFKRYREMKNQQDNNVAIK